MSGMWSMECLCELCSYYLHIRHDPGTVWTCSKDSKANLVHQLCMTLLSLAYTNTLPFFTFQPYSWTLLCKGSCITHSPFLHTSYSRHSVLHGFRFIHLYQSYSCRTACQVLHKSNLSQLRASSKLIATARQQSSLSSLSDIHHIPRTINAYLDIISMFRYCVRDA